VKHTWKIKEREVKRELVFEKRRGTERPRNAKEKDVWNDFFLWVCYDSVPWYWYG